MIRFRAMNTDVSVISTGDESAVAERVRATFAAEEQRFSRFLVDSELSRLNRAEGPFRASEELFAALVRARAYVQLTDGLFDPAIGGAVVAMGYERSFEPGALDREANHEPVFVGSFGDVLLEEGSRLVTRPSHVHLDLGGMVKGATVDRAAVLLGESGAIDAGGDALVRGGASDGQPWLVEVEDPRDPEETVAIVAVTDSAVATSSGNRRRWRAGSEWVHHLVDPRTRTSAAESLLQATVFAPTTELADVLAKVAFILGAGEAPSFLARRADVAAVLVPRSGRPIFVGDLDVREVMHA